jgi:hypothetical protein
MDIVMEYGERDATKFYIIIVGVCGVKTPNMKRIEDWVSKYKEFRRLVSWKHENF